MRKGYVVNLIQQKIRLLDVIAKDAEEISVLLMKNFSYIGLSKKKSATLRAKLNSYIKAISYSCFSFFIRIIPSSA